MYISFHFVGHIYAVVSPENNEWRSEFWLARCLEEKQTLLEPITDDENNEFPSRSMVVKGQYLNLASQQNKNNDYVY